MSYMHSPLHMYCSDMCGCLSPIRWHWGCQYVRDNCCSCAFCSFRHTQPLNFHCVHNMVRPFVCNRLTRLLTVCKCWLGVVVSAAGPVCIVLFLLFVVVLIDIALLIVRSCHTTRGLRDVLTWMLAGSKCWFVG